jgi:CheY-like chemotaxis protein
MSRRAIVVLEPRTTQADRLLARLAVLGLSDHVTLCRSGREAIDHVLPAGAPLGAAAPSAILIDLDAGIADGAEVARRIRLSDGSASIPMILITEHPSASLQAAAARLGAHLVPTGAEHDDLHRLGAVLGQIRPSKAVA